MDDIIRLVKTLSNTECLLLKAHYTQLEEQVENLRRSELLEAILSEKVKDDKEACMLLYSQKNTQAYVKLKLRMMRDLYNFLSLSDSLTEGKRLSVSEARMQCQKLLLVGQTLYFREEHALAFNAFKDGWGIAERYELSFESSECLRMMATLEAAKGMQRLSKYQDYTRKQLKRVELYQQQLQARDYYQEITVPNISAKNKEYLYIQKAEENKQKLEQLSKTYPSANITYFYYLTGVNASLICQDFAQALEFSEKLQQLVRRSKALYTPSRLAAAQIHTAICYLELGHYEKAQFLAMRVWSSGQDPQHAGTILFTSYLAENKQDQAQEIMKKVQGKLNKDSYPHQKARWKYYEAILCFAKGDFKECIRILSRHSELLKDKTGWLLGYKLLEILCHIELHNLDIAELKINSFKLFLKRNTHANLKRYQTIQVILKTLIAEELNFKLLYTKYSTELELLEKGKGPYYRDPMGFELMSFNAWLQKKKKLIP